MEPAAPELLLKAFKLMDPENRGYVERDVLTKLMMEDGEPFDQEEIDEMMAIAVDPSTGHIPYECYLNQLIVSNSSARTFCADHHVLGFLLPAAYKRRLHI